MASGTGSGRNARTDLRRPARWPAALYSMVQWQKLRRYEAWLCTRADAVAAVSQADADAWAADLDKSEALRVWITRDTRLEVAGTSIVGPAPALADWPAGMSSVLTWRNNA